MVEEQNMFVQMPVAIIRQEPDKYLTKDSVAFHTRMGYRMVGEFHRCAYKFDRWYNMVWMEKKSV